MPTERSRPPNVLWIVLEDTSPRLGCYGDDVARTPNVDALAAEGCRYPNAFSTSPVCSPSRSALHTGCYGTAIGTHHHRTAQPTGSRPGYEAVPPYYVRFLSEYLREGGYFCTMAGDTDFGHATPISAFDECSTANAWDGGKRDWMVDEADWRHREDDQPFFAVVNPSTTHESGMFVDPDDDPDTDPGAVTVPPYLPDTPVVRRTIAHHYDNLATADARVGEVLSELEAAGVAENTLVLLTSDHGEGLPRGKRWVYDSGTRVPLIVRWPEGVAAGRTDRRLVSLVDVAPTVLSLAGIAPPRHVDGRPFLGPDAEAREYVFAARDRHDEFHDTVRAVRDRNFRYVRNVQPGRPYVLWNDYRNRHPVMQEILQLRAADELEGPARAWATGRRPAEELYDLREDPHETENLADDPAYADVLDRLRGALENWIDRTDDAGLDAEAGTLERMWPGGEQPTTDPPAFVPNAPGERATERANDGGTVTAPAEVGLYCPTQGASIVYTTDEGESEDGDGDRDVRWELFTGPVSLPEGETTLRARAIRYGYAESDERRATFVVEEP
jgi:arylsulfatase A-like enzyme